MCIRKTSLEQDYIKEKTGNWASKELGGRSEPLTRGFSGQSPLRTFLGSKEHLYWIKIDLNVTEIITVQGYKYTKIKAKSQASNRWVKDITTTQKDQATRYLVWDLKYWSIFPWKFSRGPQFQRTALLGLGICFFECASKAATALLNCSRKSTVQGKAQTLTYIEENN